MQSRFKRFRFYRISDFSFFFLFFIKFLPRLFSVQCHCPLAPSTTNRYDCTAIRTLIPLRFSNSFELHKHVYARTRRLRIFVFSSESHRMTKIEKFTGFRVSTKLPSVDLNDTLWKLSDREYSVCLVWRG